jgi:hypothetical protein
MSATDLAETFAKETKERLEYDGFDIYFSFVRTTQVALEGEFTSDQLRVIADQLDRFNVELAKLNSATS